MNRRVLAVVAAASCALAAVGFSAFAFQAKRPWQPSQPAASPGDPRDLTSLVDQEGEPFSLQKLQGRTVVLNFIFTHCQTSCPLQVQALTAVQRALPAALSPRVQIVSVSIDPLRDTPDVLAQYAASMGARLDNWSFVTGHPRDISWLHQHFGAQVKRLGGDQFDHRVAAYLLDANGQFVQKYTGDLDQLRLVKEIGDVDGLYNNKARQARAQVGTR